MAIDQELFKGRLAKTLARHTTLTTIWGVVRKVQALTSDPNSSMRDLVTVIGSDPMLTARILQIVNSAVYGFSREINNLDEAVLVLGYNQLRDLCTSLAAVRGLDRDANSNFNRVEFWKHSLGTAAASRLIQARLLRTMEPDLFVAGLLCNIGRMILDQDFPEEFGEVINYSKEKDVTLLQAEQDVLGFTHAEIGAWAADVWHLNDAMIEAIRYHHGPGENKWAYVINLAYVCTQALGIGSPGDPALTELLPGTFKELNLEKAELTALLKDIEAEFDKLESFFDDTTA